MAMIQFPQKTQNIKMKTKNKRVSNPKKYLSLIKIDDDFFIALEIQDEHKPILEKLGFSKSLTEGETILPSVVGKISEFNAEGKEKIRKDLEKETVYYPREWKVTDWGGYEHSGVNYMPYERYPRELVPPPSIELQVIVNNGKKFVISPKLKNSENSIESIKHVMNLFAEIFKTFEVLKGDLTVPIKTKIMKLNWELLPVGINPWGRVKEQVKSIVESKSSGEKAMIIERFSLIEKHNPDHVAIGLGGFTGYLVFGFKSKSLYLLESLKYGNATYVLGEDWQTISQLTKAEILKNGYHKQRIIHSDDWNDSMHKVLI